MRYRKLPPAEIMSERAGLANEILRTFEPEAEILLRGRRVFVSDRPGRVRQWTLQRGQSFFPTWRPRPSFGGTATTAISQLIRWIQGRPVFPLGTWRYWAGPVVGLGSPVTLELLAGASWPESVPCVVCGQTIKGGLDWWCLDGLSGPCHTFAPTRCPQDGAAA